MWEDVFTSHRLAGRVPGRVTRVDRGRCDVATAAGPVRAGLHGLPEGERHDGVCTGDWLALDPAADGPDGTHVVVAVLPRRSALVRGSASARSDGQVLAANVDVVLVVAALDTDLDLGRIERLLALAWSSGAQPVVVLTKADQADEPADRLAEASAVAPGAEVLAVSVPTGEGLEHVRALCTSTVALIGPSGAGKSTLGNALLGQERLATGAVRAGDAKGRHTTAHRELVPLPSGGALVDTPGLRGVGLFDAADGLDQTFADIAELAAACRFTDCRHEQEPGCAVLAAIESGALEKRRLHSYRKLLREDEWAASRTDARVAAARKDRVKAMTKSLRATYRFRGR